MNSCQYKRPSCWKVCSVAKCETLQQHKNLSKEFLMSNMLLERKKVQI